MVYFGRHKLPSAESGPPPSIYFHGVVHARNICKSRAGKLCGYLPVTSLAALLCGSRDEQGDENFPGLSSTRFVYVFSIMLGDKREVPFLKYLTCALGT